MYPKLDLLILPPSSFRTRSFVLARARDNRCPEKVGSTPKVYALQRYCFHPKKSHQKKLADHVFLITTKSCLETGVFFFFTKNPGPRTRSAGGHAPKVGRVDSGWRCEIASNLGCSFWSWSKKCLQEKKTNILGTKTTEHVVDSWNKKQLNMR